MKLDFEKKKANCTEYSQNIFNILHWYLNLNLYLLTIKLYQLDLFC